MIIHWNVLNTKKSLIEKADVKFNGTGLSLLEMIHFFVNIFYEKFCFDDVVIKRN